MTSPFKSVMPSHRMRETNEQGLPRSEEEAKAQVIDEKSSHEEAAKSAGLGERVRALYKIEVRYVNRRDESGRVLSQRTVNGPNLCGVMIWESGKAFNGGGDSKMYWCKDNRQGESGGCGAPIPGQFINSGVAVCPNCNKMVNAGLLVDMYVFNSTTKDLAKAIERMFRQLGGHADIYCKYDKADVRVEAMARERGWEYANRLKGMSIYPLYRILEDTSNGADLTHKLYTFLSA